MTSWAGTVGGWVPVAWSKPPCHSTGGCGSASTGEPLTSTPLESSVTWASARARRSTGRPRASCLFRVRVHSKILSPAGRRTPSSVGGTLTGAGREDRPGESSSSGAIGLAVHRLRGSARDRSATCFGSPGESGSGLEVKCGDDCAMVGRTSHYTAEGQGGKDDPWIRGGVCRDAARGVVRPFSRPQAGRPRGASLAVGRSGRAGTPGLRRRRSRPERRGGVAKRRFLTEEERAARDAAGHLAREQRRSTPGTGEDRTVQQTLGRAGSGWHGRRSSSIRRRADCLR